MVSTEVQRTLVKSPPELWAELSDPASLARHLGELGEIRITRVQPEEQVEWEAGSTSGTITIKPSGWGTKVTLSVTRAAAAPALGDAGAEGAPDAAHQPVAEVAPAPLAPEPAGPPDLTTAERFAPQYPAPLLGDAIAQPAPEELQPEGLAQFAPGQPAAAGEGAADEPAQWAPAPAQEPPHEPGLQAPAAAPEPELLSEPAPSQLDADPEAHIDHAPDAHDELGQARDQADFDDRPPAVAGPETELAGDGQDVPGVQSRRGFFARVMDRIRGPRAEPVPADALEGEPSVELYEVDVERLTGGTVRSASEGETYAGRSREAAIEQGALGALLAHFGPWAAEPEPEPPRAEPPETQPPEGELDTDSDGLARDTLPAAAQDAPAPIAGAAEPTEAPSAADADGPTGLGGELLAAEQAGDEHVQALLTAALDSLGAAHHRPFSRS